MAINKKLIHFKNFSDFNSKKLSANENNTQYTLGINGSVTNGSPDILYQSICYIKDTKQQWTHGQLYDCSSLTDEALKTINGQTIIGTGDITLDNTYVLEFDILYDIEKLRQGTILELPYNSNALREALESNKRIYIYYDKENPESGGTSVSVSISEYYNLSFICDRHLYILDTESGDTFSQNDLSITFIPEVSQH